MPAIPTSTYSRAGLAVMTLAHVAGMVDMVALPLWVGTLMQHYRFSPAQAGLSVTLFLVGVVAASTVLAPRFNRMPRRAATAAGFAVSSTAFFVAGWQPIAASSVGLLALLQAAAGLGVGCALSITHGSIGRSANPHRLFAMVNVWLGLFAVAFLAGVPQLILQAGAQSFFVVVGATMAFAAAIAAWAFPNLPAEPQAASPNTSESETMPRAAWFLILVVVCLTLNQAMVFTFVERIGADRGFDADRVNGVLIALGLVNLLPGVLAALLQRRWSPLAVGMAGPTGQALLAVVMTHSAGFAPYAAAAALYVSMVIFTHTFIFGLLSKLDGTGRAVAATPAMMMLGSCIGPALGGALVHTLGYRSLGWAACLVATIALLAMLQVRRHLGSAAQPALAAVRA